MPRLDLTDDPGSLDRFLLAQHNSYHAALSELRQGCKQGHWMWFVFPQLRGLGRSSMAHHYGIADLDEARRYLAHPILGSRLLAAAEAALAHRGRSAEAILGGIDADKLRSSATLFAAVDHPGGVFQHVLDAFFGGRPCPLTRDRTQ